MGIRDFLHFIHPEQVGFYQEHNLSSAHRHIPEYHTPYYVYRNGVKEKSIEFDDEELEIEIDRVDESEDRMLILDALGQLRYINAGDAWPQAPKHIVKECSQDVLEFIVNYGVLESLRAVYKQASEILDDDFCSRSLLYIPSSRLLTREENGLDAFFVGETPDIRQIHKWLISEIRVQPWLKTIVIRLSID